MAASAAVASASVPTARERMKRIFLVFLDVRAYGKGRTHATGGDSP
jgi:hypothetical protein